MKKRLLLIPVLVLLVLLCASPVFADDMEVDIAVVTPGDVDLDVGINAGGDVGITIDGVDFQDTANTAQAAYDMATAPPQPTNFMGDWIQYWTITGLGARVDAQIAELQGLISMIAAAEAKLIEGQELTGGEIDRIDRALGYIKTGNDSSFTGVNNAISGLQAQDEKTWNQLMYGAEHHLSLLDAREAEDVARLEVINTQLRESLGVAHHNQRVLSSYVEHIGTQHLYYIWILSGVSAVLFLVVIGLLIGVVRHSRSRLAR